MSLQSEPASFVAETRDLPDGLPGRGRVMITEIDVEFGECDPAQIVFYPNYFTYFDRATWRLFASVGLPRSVMHERFGVPGQPIAKAEISFHAPATAFQRLTIESRVVRWGNASFDVGHRIRHADGQLVAEGKETRVWVAHDPTRKIGHMSASRIPDAVIALFGGRRAGHAAGDDDGGA